MKLSEIGLEIHIIRDADFDQLGNSNTDTRNLLCYADTISYVKKANCNKNLAAIIVPDHLIAFVCYGVGIISSPQPRSCFYKIYEQLRKSKYFQPDFEYGRGDNLSIHPTAFVSEKTYLGHNVTIGPNATILDNVYIGDHTIVEANAVLGADGILYSLSENKNLEHIRHAGSLKIGANVTVLSNATVVKSVFPHTPTIVGDFSIIGIGSIIGHDAVVDKNCIISGNCVIARGARVMTGGHIYTGAVLREYVVTGKNAKIMAGSIVVNNVPDNGEVSGNFALRHGFQRKEFVKKLKESKQ